MQDLTAQQEADLRVDMEMLDNILKARVMALILPRCICLVCFYADVCKVEWSGCHVS